MSSDSEVDMCGEGGDLFDLLDECSDDDWAPSKTIAAAAAPAEDIATEPVRESKPLWQPGKVDASSSDPAKREE